VATQLEKHGERHAQEQVNAIAKQPHKGFAGRVDEAVVRVSPFGSSTTTTAGHVWRAGQDERVSAQR
jgi:hypothetical protein